MKILILLFALVGVSLADRDCDTLARIKVKAQWAAAFGAGHHRVDFSKALWRALFNQAPASRDLFKRVDGHDINSPKFTAHGLRVLGGLDICITLLDDEEKLNDELQHLHSQHVERRVPVSYFDLLKNALLKVIPATIGRCYDVEVWDACFDIIADGVINGTK